MITVRPGSHMYCVLRLLSVSGEFPSKSLEIIGDKRTVKAMVHRMEAVQKIRLYSDDTVLTTKLFQISGKGADRTLRLTKNAVTVLNEIHQDALGYYLKLNPDNKFTGNKFNVSRNHRVGETVAMCMMSGIESAPYVLPRLQKKSILRIVPETPSYYLSRDFKKIYQTELNKTKFTRLTGLLFYPGGSYAVYNTRNAVMKWSGLGELKVRNELDEIVRMNAGLDEVRSAILFGSSGEVALNMIMESNKSTIKQDRFDNVYNSTHFVPLDQNGVNLLKILILPDWREKLMSAVFNQEMRAKGFSSIEFDARRDNLYFYSHFDSDIARLIRFKGSLKPEYSFHVLCFPWQIKFLQSYLGDSVVLKQLDMPAVLKALGIK